MAALLVLAALSEGALRVAGKKPLNVAEQLAATIPDAWTGWRMRPNVQSGPEYVWTNNFGIHAKDDVALEKAPGKFRVAMLGSSVVYGIGLNLADTLPARTEEALKAANINAEVINFGNHGFNATNVSALLQIYVMQFRPDAVVVVADPQIIFPKLPVVTPASESATAVKQLSGFAALLKKGAQYSAALALMDDRWHRSAAAAPVLTKTKTAVPAAAVESAQEKVPGVHEWEEQRRRELFPTFSALAAFCAASKVRLFLVTPYGPYYKHTEEELQRFPLHVYAASKKVYGSYSLAMQKEAELATAVFHEVGRRHGAVVVDMLERSKNFSFQTSKDISHDGIHLNAEGSLSVGRLIATRIMREFQGVAGHAAR